MTVCGGRQIPALIKQRAVPMDLILQVIPAAVLAALKVGGYGVEILNEAAVLNAKQSAAVDG